MLQALNRTVHTPYVNATLSAFDKNWCAQRLCSRRCATTILGSVLWSADEWQPSNSSLATLDGVNAFQGSLVKACLVNLPAVHGSGGN